MDGVLKSAMKTRTSPADFHKHCVSGFGHSGSYYLYRAGGIYSSTADLCKLGRAILANAQLSSSSTRRWLKPVAHTNSAYRSFGAPWEIFRVPVDPSSNYIVDMYMKLGDLFAFSTWFVVIPDFGVTISVCVAGSEDLRWTLMKLLSTTVLPKLYEIARNQAGVKLAGHYVASGGLNSTVTLSTDGKAGLLIADAVTNGTTFAEFFKAIGQKNPTAPARLFPSGFRSTVSASSSASNSSAEVVEQIGFRLVLEEEETGPNPDGSTWENAGPAFDDPCMSWLSVSDPLYGNVAFDDVVIGVDKNGRGVEVDMRAFRTVLRRRA